MKSMVRGELEQKIQDFDRAQAACGTATGEGECRTVRYERSAATESRADSTQLYLSEIGYKPMLTAEQEVHYARQARAGHEDGRKRMVEGNLRLVVKIAAHYRWRGLSFSDLIEEGNLGLLHAVEKFDPERGFRFSTYAIWWIRQNIERGLMCQTRAIRLPTHIAKELNVLKRAERELTGIKGREPLVEEIAEYTGRPLERVKRVLAVNARMYSVDAPISNEVDIPLLEIFPNRTEPEPGDCYGRNELRHRLLAWLEELTPRQREVLLRRYGLEGHECDTLERVGKEVGLTRERTRQVQLEALKKLRRILARDGLARDILQELA